MAGYKQLVYNQIKAVLKFLQLSCKHVNWITLVELKTELKKG